MDYEKLLRAYIRHVTHCEGTDFLAPFVDSDLLLEGDLTPDEAKRLIAIGEEERLGVKVI